MLVIGHSKLHHPACNLGQLLRHLWVVFDELQLCFASLRKSQFLVAEREHGACSLTSRYVSAAVISASPLAIWTCFSNQVIATSISLF